MASKCEQRLDCASGGKTGNLHDVNKLSTVAYDVPYFQHHVKSCL